MTKRKIFQIIEFVVISAVIVLAGLVGYSRGVQHGIDLSFTVAESNVQKSYALLDSARAIIEMLPTVHPCDTMDVSGELSRTGMYIRGCRPWQRNKNGTVLP